MTVVGWPPILTVRHQGVEVFLQSLIVKVFEGLSIVKVLAHGVGLAVVLVEDVQIEVFGHQSWFERLSEVEDVIPPPCMTGHLPSLP